MIVIGIMLGPESRMQYTFASVVKGFAGLHLGGWKDSCRIAGLRGMG